MSHTPFDRRLMIHAALDGELDASGMVAFERAMADDPQLANDFQRQQELRRVLRDKFAGEAAPAALRARVESRVAPARMVSRRIALSSAAAFVLGIGLGGAATFALLRIERRATDLTDDVVSAHRRALLAASPVDIASNDHQNVRPWFDARTAISPPTPDLAARGFPLVGGRVDVVQDGPVPALVYRYKEHYISLTSLPRGALTSPAFAPEGYRVVVWQDGNFVYWAISDADQSHLEDFARAFQAAENGAPGS
jgi:anti-sigma factor RsiW